MQYTKTHEWVRVDQNIATVGITEFAQKELGDIVYVELPLIGHSIKAEEEVAVLESTKAAVDLYSPISGEIVEVNESLREFPEKINNSPEKEGWIFKIKISNSKELTSLMNETDYRSLLKNI